MTDFAILKIHSLVHGNDTYDLLTSFYSCCCHYSYLSWSNHRINRQPRTAAEVAIDQCGRPNEEAP